jgi:hypothetical protein
MKKLLLLFLLTVLAYPAFAGKWAHDMSQKQFQRLAAELNATADENEGLFLKAADILGLDHPALPFYLPIVETWANNADHNAGTHYARHMTPEMEDWLETKLKPTLTEIGAALVIDKKGQVLFQEMDAQHTEIGANDLIAMKAHPPVESEPDEFVASDSSRPDFNHLFGDVKLAHAIKEKLNDPASYQTISIGEPFPDTFNGMPCWTVIVKFSARNAFNAVMRSSACVSLVKMGGEWEVVKCEINV